MRMADLRVVEAGRIAPPYPADTCVNGFTFNLDCRRIQQSDTWLLVPLELRGALLLMWFEAWQQIPAGSLPDADDLIAARVGMSLPMFQTHRVAIMRGWFKCTDGRLYHPVIVDMVRERLVWRESNAARMNAWRERKRNALVTESDALQAVTVTGCNGPVTGCNDKEKEKEKEKDKTPTPSTAVTRSDALQARTKGNRMDPASPCPNEWRDWVVETYGVTPQRAVQVFVEFRDYWQDIPGQRGLKVRWLGTFKNRCRALHAKGAL